MLSCCASLTPRWTRLRAGGGIRQSVHSGVKTRGSVNQDRRIPCEVLRVQSDRICKWLFRSRDHHWHRRLVVGSRDHATRAGKISDPNLGLFSHGNPPLRCFFPSSTNRQPHLPTYLSTRATHLPEPWHGRLLRYFASSCRWLEVRMTPLVAFVAIESDEARS